MARCASCGSENKPDTRFCRQCGKMLEAAPLPPDDDPITVVPGEPQGPVRPASPNRGGLVIGLILASLAAATGVGYFVGTRSAGSPAVEPAKTAEPQPASTTQTQLHFSEVADPTPAATEQATQKSAEEVPPPEKTKRAQAASAKQALKAPAPATAVPPPSQEAESTTQHWATMRQELAACGKFNLVCHEKVRWRYCKGMWNKVAECPQAKASVPTN